jgi:hypothetical protein
MEAFYCRREAQRSSGTPGVSFGTTPGDVSPFLYLDPKGGTLRGYTSVPNIDHRVADFFAVADDYRIETMKFTDTHYEEFISQGYTILNDALPEEKCVAIAQGLRSCIAPWDDIKDNPPEHRSAMQGFPFPSLALNRFFVEPDLVAFVQRLFGSENIQYRPGYSIARYPGEKVGSNQGWHIDNGNNSLLPESEDWRYGQVVVWYFPEPVEREQGALCIIPKPHENDLDHVIPLTGPGNTMAIFNNYLWHSGSDFTVDYGQRYSHAGMYGLSEFCAWEGLCHFTMSGRNAAFKELIGTLTAREREIMRFPAAGHPYYTTKTLELLEQQYPGWNARCEYTAAH